MKPGFPGFARGAFRFFAARFVAPSFFEQVLRAAGDGIDIPAGRRKQAGAGGSCSSRKAGNPGLIV